MDRENIPIFPAVDRAERGGDWVKGYKNGECVITFAGVSDFSAIKLYNDDGDEVIPAAVAPELDPVEFLSALMETFS